MKITRNFYLNQLIQGKQNGLIKIITGIRRCGKSYLLFNLFYQHLISVGVNDDHIIKIALDDIESSTLRDPLALYRHIKEKMVDNDLYYILLDEIQLVPHFEDVLNSFLRIENADVYVTGSNSKFLSSDIITEFRGRSDEIRLYPLSLSEYCSGTGLKPADAWKDYYTFGGLPHVLSLETDKKKLDYLYNLFESVYMIDILERHKIKKQSEIQDLIRITASNIGAPTNSTKLSNTFKSVKKVAISHNTIDRYLGYMIDAFIIEKAMRFDIKGKKYIGSLSKYYFTDMGLRNAVLGLRQQEESHIMENIIYNELRRRGCKVDVGIVDQRMVDSNGKWQRKQFEVDFVVNEGSKRYYIQSALSIPDEEKRKQEIASLLRIGDSFQKIIIVKDDIKSWTDENGIQIMGLFDFLMGEESFLQSKA
ncbi:MAG: ATP-binding protein [Bacteroidales bacterium]|nr:ATP-binding protein [Bacteroidales bacterium]MDY5194136.1 ATP-binding protein [Candidatus Aphodosoma sp.]